MVSKSFLKFIKGKRLEAGLGQIVVAKQLKYSSSQMVSNWERGLCLPPTRSLKALSKMYSVSKTEMLERYLNEIKLMVLKDWK